MKIYSGWDVTQRLDKLVDISKGKELILKARAKRARTHLT